MVKRGFTLLELLIVMFIIVVLASLMTVSYNLIYKSLEKAKTEEIILLVHNALALQATEQGVRIAPSEHPLAASSSHDYFGTTVQRAIFYRADGVTPVARTGEALTVQDIAWLSDATAQARTLLPDDVYAGHQEVGDTPHLFGLPRERIGILAPATEWISMHRQLPDIDGNYRDPSDSSKLLGPYDDTVYEDKLWLQKPLLGEGETLEARSTAWLDYLTGDQLDELTELNAFASSPAADDSSWHQTTQTIEAMTGGTSGRNMDEWRGNRSNRTTIQRTTSTTRTYNRNVDVTAPEEGQYDPTNRVWLGARTSAAWKPGFHAINGTFTEYRIRGKSLVDSWGNEILFWTDSDGGYHLTSSGPDGAFMVHPGDNGQIDTQLDNFVFPDPATIDGADEDGRRDNIGKVP